MNKRIICAILVTLSAISLISCSVSKRKDNILTKVPEEVTENNNKGSKDGKGLVRKREFNNKLNEIVKEMDKKKYGARRNDVELKKVYDEGYKKWEAALAEISEIIKENINVNEKSKFEEDEERWIKEREEKAKKGSDGLIDEGIRDLKYMESKEQTTQDRCYNLVKDYMKYERGSV